MRLLRQHGLEKPDWDLQSADKSNHLLESQKSAENIATYRKPPEKSQIVSDSMTTSLDEVKSGNEAVGRHYDV